MYLMKTAKAHEVRVVVSHVEMYGAVQMKNTWPRSPLRDTFIKKSSGGIESRFEARHGPINNVVIIECHN